MTPDQEKYRRLKADPVKYAALIERKRRERARKPEYERERKRKWRAANPEKVKRIRDAGHAVETAVRRGELYKRNSCQACRMIGKVEAHHHKGYEPDHWLDVQWLCAMCHAKADKRATVEI